MTPLLLHAAHLPCLPKPHTTDRRPCRHPFHHANSNHSVHYYYVLYMFIFSVHPCHPSPWPGVRWFIRYMFMCIFMAWTQCQNVYDCWLFTVINSSGFLQTCAIPRHQAFITESVIRLTACLCNRKQMLRLYWHWCSSCRRPCTYSKWFPLIEHETPGNCVRFPFKTPYTIAN